MKKLSVLLLALLLCGCAARQEQAEPTAAPTAAPTETLPAETAPVSPVYTDWSKLEPYEPVSAVYGYHEGYTADGEFEPRDDYGALLPYIGKCSVMEMYVIDALPLYGLVTDSGELVSEPVYARAVFYDDFLLLYRGDPEGISGGDSHSGGGYSRTLAAADGSWAHELDGYYVTGGKDILMTAKPDGSLELWNSKGEVVVSFAGEQFKPYFGEKFTWGGEGGPGVNWTDGRMGYVDWYYNIDQYTWGELRLYLDFATGEVSESPLEGYPAQIEYDTMPEPPMVEGCNYLDQIRDKVTGEIYFQGYYRNEEQPEGRYAIFDGEGKLLADNCDMMPFETMTIVRGGLYSKLEDDCFCFRSLSDGSLVFRYPMSTNSD